MSLDELLSALIYRSPPHIIEHLQIVSLSLFAAVLISFPLGIILTRHNYKHYGERVLAILNIGQTIPPLAVICIFLPFFGIGTRPAVFALTIYALLPIARNTIAGLTSVPNDIKESARGMGMKDKEVLMQVELPLSLPVILTGIKTSAILTIGTATLAALVGAGGMGAVIFAGINFFKVELVIAGTLVLAIMAIIFERMIAIFEIVLLPKHMR